jgi:hypothetical protein
VNPAVAGFLFGILFRLNRLIFKFKIMRIFTTILLLIGFGLACNTSSGKVFNNRLQKEYSPDNSKNVEVYEAGLDSVECSTQVIVNFKNNGSGVYSVQGNNKGIKVYWKDNSTIVIETFKNYNTTQKLSEIQSFGEVVKVEYVEK